MIFLTDRSKFDGQNPIVGELLCEKNRKKLDEDYFNTNSILEQHLKTTSQG